MTQLSGLWEQARAMAPGAGREEGPAQLSPLLPGLGLEAWSRLTEGTGGPADSCSGERLWGPGRREQEVVVVSAVQDPGLRKTGGDAEPESWRDKLLWCLGLQLEGVASHRARRNPVPDDTNPT